MAEICVIFTSSVESTMHPLAKFFVVNFTGYVPGPGKMCVGLYALSMGEPSLKFHATESAPWLKFVNTTESGLIQLYWMLKNGIGCLTAIISLTVSVSAQPLL